MTAWWTRPRLTPDISCECADFTLAHTAAPPNLIYSMHAHSQAHALPYLAYCCAESIILLWQCSPDSHLTGMCSCQATSCFSRGCLKMARALIRQWSASGWGCQINDPSLPPVCHGARWLNGSLPLTLAAAAAHTTVDSRLVHPLKH